jgi:hypothetical protein
MANISSNNEYELWKAKREVVDSCFPIVLSQIIHAYVGSSIKLDETKTFVKEELFFHEAKVWCTVKLFQFPFVNRLELFYCHKRFIVICEEKRYILQCLTGQTTDNYQVGLRKDLHGFRRSKCRHFAEFNFMLQIMYNYTCFSGIALDVLLLIEKYSGKNAEVRENDLCTNWLRPTQSF